MRTILLPTFITALVLSAAPSALGQATVRKDAGRGYDEVVGPAGQVARKDNTGKGAVMCLWGIYAAAQLAGDECEKGHDVEFQRELAKSVAQVDQFILRNSSTPIAQADLDRRRAAAAAQVRRQGPLCTGDAYAMYEALRTRGSAALKAVTTDALSVPREPVMNPCL